MSAKSYHEKAAAPLVRKLKSVIRSILLQFFEKTRELQRALDRANSQIWELSNRLEKVEVENARLHGIEKNYGLLRRGLSDDRANEIISVMKAQEAVQKKPTIKRGYVR
ncbi:MAG: hypothetical protein A4E55_01945 [Pelotomaculum sp. PtaU1.Bin035]|nr:MAG: hypothetical protein A4E55_01945 [Pelotomaculum sp. PtaU1.Bin035]